MFEDSIDKTDNKKLLALEETIEEGLRIFADVGSALLQIRDGKLYRADFKTFEEYCQEKWGMERAHAYRLIDSAKVVENLKSSPIGDKLEPPTTEAQTRPLALLAPEQQVEAWQEATEKAPKGEKPTGGLVKKIADRIRAKIGPKKEPKNPGSWTVEDLKKDKELMDCFTAIAAVYGNSSTKAIREGLIGLKRADVTYLAKLPKAKMLEIQGLVMGGNRWKPQKAVAFLDKMADENSKIVDVINWTIAANGIFTATFRNGAFTVTCKANRK
jgi:hypothetical protein